jgi:hypothetical protein
MIRSLPGPAINFKHSLVALCFGVLAWLPACNALADVEFSFGSSLPRGPVQNFKTWTQHYVCETKGTAHMSVPFSIPSASSLVNFGAEKSMFARQLQRQLGKSFDLGRDIHCWSMNSQSDAQGYFSRSQARYPGVVVISMDGADRDLWMMVSAWTSDANNNGRHYYSQPVHVSVIPSVEQMAKLFEQIKQKANYSSGSITGYIDFALAQEQLKTARETRAKNKPESNILLNWRPGTALTKEELRKQQEEERQAKLKEQKAKQEAEKQKKLEADKLAKEQAERERQRKAEETRREWEAKLFAQNQAIQERAAPVMAQVDDAVFQEADKAAKKPAKKKEKKNLQQFMEAVVVCTKPNARGGFRCTGPLTAMDGSASDISGFRGPEEMVAKNMNAQCPDLRPLHVSGEMKVWGCGFAATGGVNAKDASGGLVIPGRQTYYCTPKQLSCRNQTAPSDL